MNNFKADEKYNKVSISLNSTGGKLKEFLKPRLHAVEDDILSPLAWYNNPKLSNSNMLCFVKISVQVITFLSKVSALRRSAAKDNLFKLFFLPLFFALKIYNNFLIPKLL